MTGLLRKAMLFACAGVLAASSAMAAVPSPADSDVPCGINLVGTTGGVADAHGEVTITIRDLSHNPIPGSAVVLDLNTCEIDSRICQAQPFAGVNSDCSGLVGSINGVTDGTGTLKLRIVGGGRNPGPAEGFKCATLYADGVNMGSINIGIYDQNAVGGVNPVDIALWLSDSFSPPFEGRSDYNCTNSINPVDLALLLSVSIPGTSFNSCASYCH